ncbi:MAG TPA: ADOP family duplicated permease [Gemmatimonadaceae bacterium]
MSLSAIRSGLRRLFRKDAVERDLDDEIAQYIELATREYIRAGLSAEAARRAARAEFGGVEAAKEDIRSWGWESVVESLIRDLGYAWRVLRASPSYAIVAITTLGIGIGLTTSVVTASHAVLDQHWPVADPTRVVTIVGRGGPGFSPAEARYVAAHSTTLSGLVIVRCLAGTNDECQLRLEDSPARTDLVSGNYFATIGVGMELGRGLSSDDDELSAPRAVVVLSDATWRSRFGADSTIIGRRVRIDDVPFTVVGVAPRGFPGTRMEREDVWLPLSAMVLLRPGRQDVRDQLTDPSSDHSDASIAARLAPGVSIARAESEITTLNRRYRAEHALDDRDVRLTLATLFPNPAKLRTAKAEFALMVTAVVLVLMLACANVGNLLLARAAARRREIAVRLAIGASRSRVVRQLLAESLLLAAIGGLIGLVIALVLPGALMTQINGPLSLRLMPDALVIGIALALVTLSCLAFGLAPALHATRAGVSAALKSGAEPMRRSPSRPSLRGSLLAIQIAISLLLLVNAGVLIRGIQRGRGSDLGFRSRDVNLLYFDLPPSDIPSRTRSFSRQLVMESRSSAGAAIAFASSAPLGGAQYARFRLPGESAKESHVTATLDISKGFLDVLAIPVVAGRDLIESDGDDAVLVNESMARDVWPGQSALGKIVIDTIERRVVGVVRDANLIHIDRVDHLMIRPVGARGVPVMLVRGASPAIIQSVAAVAERLDSRVHVRVDSVAANVDRQLGDLGVIATLAGVLGLIALVLASVGVFGVFAYVVQQRTREIGIRTALGASPRRVITLMVRDSARSIVAGIITGFAAAVGVSRLLQSELFGATPFDPVVFGAIAGVLAVAGVLATFVPARRAARIDPTIALRDE